MKCKKCSASVKRVAREKHETVCPNRNVKCLNCGLEYMFIKRKVLMEIILKFKNVFFNIKENFCIKSIECLHQLLKSRRLIVVLFHLILIMVFKLGNLESWKKKESNSIVRLYINYVSCLTNRSFYMRTLSLSRSLVHGEVPDLQLCKVCFSMKIIDPKNRSLGTRVQFSMTSSFFFFYLYHFI